MTEICTKFMYFTTNGFRHQMVHDTVNIKNAAGRIENDFFLTIYYIIHRLGGAIQIPYVLYKYVNS